MAEQPVAGAGVEALTGITVLDLTDSVAGQFCGRLFADNGALVTLVEDVTGSRLRWEPRSRAGADRTSTLFTHLNQGKAGVALATGSPEGVARVRDLARSADVVVIDQGDLAALAEAERWGRIRCRITPFGTSPPWSRWRGDELVFQALSGTMNENGVDGREPLYGCGHRASYAAGVIGYVESLALLLGDVPDRLVDVCVAEVAASMSYNRATQFGYNGSTEGLDARTTPRATLRCADGWLNLFLSADRWERTCAGLGMPELVADERFRTQAERLANWPALEAEMEARLRDRPVADVVAAAQRYKAVVAACVSPAALADDAQLRARDYWTYWRDGDTRLGPMFRMSDTPQRPHGGAPSPPATVREGVRT
jgi:crotonobetainyl-CoA:carnitine CoA-transferase CaiB-like acyl-CoA transferase